MIPTKVYDLFIDLIPMTILFSVVMIIMRLTIIMYTKEKINIYKELKNLIFIIYCFGLFQLITTSDFESYSNNFVPFREIMRYKTTSILFYRNVIGNIALFIPFGYLITDSIKSKVGKSNIAVTSIITIVTSLTTEIIQMFIGRSFDVDDITLNFVGGIIGYFIYMISHKIYNKLPEKYQNSLTRIIGFLLMILIFLAIMIILYEVKK